jgi:cytosine/adenosine deaminase-related metal-dependent hydrolase
MQWILGALPRIGTPGNITSGPGGIAGCAGCELPERSGRLTDEEGQDGTAASQHEILRLGVNAGSRSPARARVAGDEAARASAALRLRAGTGPGVRASEGEPKPARGLQKDGANSRAA